jgi:hypothetical protein
MSIKLDLACGPKPKEGFVGVDISPCPGVSLVCDLLSFPWPWLDSSVSDVRCSHFLEHVPGKLRGKWMDELFRILEPAAIAVFIVPAWDSPAAVQDFTHEWPPICKESFLYFNAESRRVLGIDHYAVTCDFRIAQMQGFVENGVEQLAVQLVKPV